MATNVQSNPAYYSLASLTSSKNGPSRTVVLHKRPDHNGFGVYIGEDVPKGLYVVTVEINSPAADAKIQPGDRVLAVNGQLVSSMRTDPKEELTRAATNTESLTLTIESTDLFQKLNIPLTNSYNNDTNNNDTNNKSHSNRSSQRSSKQRLDITSDLESYIKSLFANEDIEIMSTSLNNNEYVLTSDRNAKSPSNFNSFQPHQYRSNDHEREHHHHHHHRRHPHRHSKQAFRDTKQTQTSLNDDQDENTQQLSPTRQYPSQPIMGTSQRILRNLPSNPNDSGSNGSQEYKLSSTNKSSESGARSRSSTPPYDSSGYSKTNRTPLPATTGTVFAAAPSPTPNNVVRNIPNNTHRPSQHMIDIVDAAVVASRNREQANNREQNPSHNPASVTTRTTTPPPPPPPPPPPQNSRDSGTARHPTPATTRTTTPPPPPQNSRDNNTRGPAPATTRTTTPPPRNSRDGGTSRHPVPATTQSTAPPPPQNSRDNNTRGSAPASTRTTTPPPQNSRDGGTSRHPTPATTQPTAPPPPQNSRDNNTRGPAPVTTRTTTPPPQNSRDGGTTRHPAPITTQSTAPPPPQNSRDNNTCGPTRDTTQIPGAPPPYTPAAPVDNRASASEGAYNVRGAQEGQPHEEANEAADSTPLPPRGEGLHDVHLERTPDFQGFGFHLQYNKSYYLVHRVETGSPAEAGGLRTNDVIHTINNQMTENMLHADFVQIVSGSSKVDFVVQGVDEYLRAHPQPPRNQHAATSVAAAISGENEKRKSGISRALNKLTNR